MKIFYLSAGWQGSIAVVADTEVEARALMEGHANYDPSCSLEEHEIKQGLVLANYGDI